MVPLRFFDSFPQVVHFQSTAVPEGIPPRWPAFPKQNRINHSLIEVV
jgi:hypothetical protein